MRNAKPGVESPGYVGVPSHTMREGGLTTSVGNSSVGNGVSVGVERICVGRGTGVDVSTTEGSLVGASKD